MIFLRMDGTTFEDVVDAPLLSDYEPTHELVGIEGGDGNDDEEHVPENNDTELGLTEDVEEVQGYTNEESASTSEDGDDIEVLTADKIPAY